MLLLFPLGKKMENIFLGIFSSIIFFIDVFFIHEHKLASAIFSILFVLFSMWILSSVFFFFSLY